MTKLGASLDDDLYYVFVHTMLKNLVHKKKIINKPRYDIVYLYTILNFYRAFFSSISPNQGKEGKSPAGYK